MAYVWLAATGLIPAVWLFLRRRDRGRLLALFLMAGALVLSADYFALGLLGLYEYIPGLFRDHMVDLTFGIFTAEVGFVAGLTVLLAVLAPDWRGVAIGTAMVVALELLFTRLGLFVTHGWRTWYTVVGFILYFALMFWFWRYIIRRGVARGWPRLLVRLGIVGWLWNVLGILSTWVSPSLTMQVSWLPEFYQNQALMAGVTLGPWTPVTLWVMAGRGENRWRRLLLGALALILLGFAWTASGFWGFRAPYSLAWHLLAQVGTMALAVLIDDWIGRSE